MKRREVIKLTSALAVLGATSASARATSAGASYPTKPVKLVVPYPAGGTFDSSARFIADKLQARWKQPVIVENKPGASGMLAYTQVARVEPDGYTLLIVGTSLVLNYSTFKNVTYQLDDFIGLAGLVDMPYGVAVKKDFPASNMKEFIAALKAAPGKYSIGNAGASERIAAQSLREKEGIDFLDVPYPGTSALVNAIASGQVDSAITAAGTLRPMHQAGRIKVIAVTGGKRLEDFPGVTTVAEAGYQGGDLTSWVGVLAPKKIDPGIAQKISADIIESMGEKDIIARFGQQTLVPHVRGGADFDKFIRVEDARWRTAARAAGIVPE